MPLTPTTPAVVGAAQIGYQNLLTGNPTDPELLTPDTWQRWRPTGADNTTTSLSTPASCDYIGIAAHTLTGVEIIVQTSATIGGALTTRSTTTPTDNRPIIIALADLTIGDVKILVDGACEIGVVYAGNLMEMERPLYGGHSPNDLNPTAVYQSNISESGQFLGRQIIRKGGDTQFNWRNLTAAWVRSTFAAFVESALTRPFFIQWRPDEYAADISFAHTTGMIALTNQGGSSELMSASMKVRAHSDI